MGLKEFVPPAILGQLKKLKRGGHKLYTSYDQALAECGAGYEENDLVEVIFRKTKRYRDEILAEKPLKLDNVTIRVVAGLSLAISGKELRVIDFGGSCGSRYFLAKSLFGNSISLRWAVVETPQMAKAGHALEDGQLKFYDDIAKAKNDLGKVDLLFTSGALQFVSNPYDSLKNLTRCSAKHIFITRQGLSPIDADLVTVRKSKLSLNGPGPMPEGIQDRITKYPLIFVRKDTFEQILSENYHICFQLMEDRNAFMAGNHYISLFGYFGSLKKI